MVELFADQSTRKPPKLRTLDERPAQPLVMPIEHIVDQHAYVGVGHLIPGDASFTEKFNALFDPYAGVTGVNSRRLSPEYAEMLRQSGGDFEAIPAVARHRPAQRATLIFAHGLAPEADLSAQPKEFGMTDPPVEKFPVVLSAGTLAAAVGPILKVRPKFEGKEKKKIKSRELIVMLGTQKPEDEAVMLAPSRDIKRTEEGSYLYESVTPEEKEEAIRIARSKTFKLTAKNCPEYPHWKGLEVAYDSARECWTIGGIPYEKARLDATKAGNTIHAVDMTIDTSSAKAEPDKLAAALVRARKLKYPVVTVNAISGLDKLCVDTTTGALFRALALLKQQFQKVEFPKPARDGMQASDELMVFPQDAEAYMFMLCVSALYPGALRASDVPTFEIRDVQLLRWIENRIAELTITRRSTTEREEAIVTPEEMWQFRNPVSRSDESKSADLDEMQKQSVEDLSGRFLADGYRGHFVFVPTGGGKTRITMQFLRSLAESEPKKFPAKYVVWLTPKETIESLSIFQELRLSGSPPIVFCEPETRPMAKKFKKAKNPVLSLEKKKREKQLKKQQMVSSARLAKNSQIVPWCVNVVKDDTLRDIAERLLPVAHEIALVIDEADRFYNMTKRTSWTYELARLSPLFVCQTGTPMRSTKDEGLRMWLQQTVGFPVTPRNWLVAASTMIAKTLDLGIEVSDITETVDVDVPALRTKGYETLVKQRDWAHAADVVYEITDQTLVGIAIREAARDRREFDEYTRNAVIKFEELTARKDRNEKLTDAENDELLTSEMIARERNTKGGILLEARNREHAADLARAINAILDAVPQGFRAGGIKNGEDDDYGIIVLPKDYARGFNFATRFGALVRGVNPGNAATRRQMLGRILRMGQRRIRVKVITVYMKDTIVEELYKKQNTADGYNKAFDAMADKFDSKLLLERFEK